MSVELEETVLPDINNVKDHNPDGILHFTHCSRFVAICGARLKGKNYGPSGDKLSDCEDCNAIVDFHMVDCNKKPWQE